MIALAQGRPDVADALLIQTESTTTHMGGSGQMTFVSKTRREHVARDVGNKELRKDSVVGEVLATHNHDESSSDAGVGRVTSIVDEGGTRRLHYDELTGKVSRVVRNFVSRGENRTFEVAYRYSPAGTLLEKRLPAAELSLAYDYHPEGSLREARLLDPEHRIIQSGDVIPIVELSAPDALGNSAQVRYGNGVTVNNTFDGLGNRTRMAAQGASGALADQGFEYNQEGLIVKKTDNLGQGVDTTEEFQYDQMRRLVSATGPYGTAAQPRATIQYGHGPDGQLRRKGIYSAGYLGPHRLTQVGAVAYRYDVQNGPGRGNVVTRVQRAPGGEVINAPDGAANVVPGSGDINATITYGPFNRVARVESQSPLGWTQATYKYEDSGRRFQKLVTVGGNVIETSYVSGDYRIERRNDGETHTVEFSLGHTLIARHSFEFDSGSFTAGMTRGLHQERMLAEAGRFFSASLSSWPGHLLGFVRHAGIWVSLDPRLPARLFYVVFAAVLVLSLFWLVWVWRHDGQLAVWLLPMPILRGVSLVLLFTFQGMLLQGCMGVLGPEDGDRPPLFALPPNGQFNAGGGSVGGGGGAGAGGQVAAYARGHLGSYFYIPAANGSTDIVTDGRGVVVQRYVYDPYGSMNRALSDFDPDGDGQYFQPAFRFTGQEYDDETGLYNYHARLYDPGTGRFIQPDPVHTDRPGMDSYDRYQYVNNNPLNFVDPGGESWLKNRLGVGAGGNRVIHRFNRATKGFRFISRWAQNASADANKQIFGKHHNEQTWGSARGMVRNFGRMVHHFTNPAFWLGYAIFLVDLTVGNLYNLATGRGLATYSYRGGALLVKNSGLMNMGTDFGIGQGLGMGPFAFVPENASPALIQHELAHVRQYYSWGGWNYFGRSMDRLIRGKRWMEANADYRANTWEYPQQDARYAMLAFLLGGLKTYYALSGAYTGDADDTLTAVMLARAGY